MQTDMTIAPVTGTLHPRGWILRRPVGQPVELKALQG